MKKLLLGICGLLGQVMAETIVVHLDVNGTIMAADLAQGKTGEVAIAHELAKKTVGIWRDDLPEMRYQDYVERHLILGPESDQLIKKQRREIYLKFLSMLQTNQHPDLDQIQTRYNELIHILQAQQDPLFASFWNLVDWALQSDHDIRFVFRTFGQDIPEIIGLLKSSGHCLQNLFAYDNGQLYRGHFHGHTFAKHEICHNLSDVFSNRFNAIRDDWKLWNSQGEQEEYAKPFHKMEGIVSIFFDDNAAEKQIIAPKGFVSTEGEPLTTQDLLNSGHIVAVSPLKAMVLPEYFIQKIKVLLSK